MVGNWSVSSGCLGNGNPGQLRPPHFEQWAPAISVLVLIFLFLSFVWVGFEDRLLVCSLNMLFRKWLGIVMRQKHSSVAIPPASTALTPLAERTPDTSDLLGRVAHFDDEYGPTPQLGRTKICREGPKGGDWPVPEVSGSWSVI